MGGSADDLTSDPSVRADLLAAPRDPGQAMRTSVVRCDDLSIGYGSVTLMSGLSFEVQRGAVFCILGGSGTGKSTLLRTLIGLTPALRGTFQIAADVADPSPHGNRPRAIQVGVPQYGVMFQSGALFGSMTVWENVALPIRRWRALSARALDLAVRSKLQQVGLDGFEHHLPEELSGGMKKRAGIARALALDPALVFFDEPSAGLDPIAARDLDELISVLAVDLGMTIVVVTHELESIFRIASDCVLLDRDARGIIARGDPRTLRDASDDPRVTRFFRREPSARPERSGPRETEQEHA